MGQPIFFHSSKIWNGPMVESIRKGGDEAWNKSY